MSARPSVVSATLAHVQSEFELAVLRHVVMVDTVEKLCVEMDNLERAHLCEQVREKAKLYAEAKERAERYREEWMQWEQRLKEFAVAVGGETVGLQSGTTEIKERVLVHSAGHGAVAAMTPENMKKVCVSAGPAPVMISLLLSYILLTLTEYEPDTLSPSASPSHYHHLRYTTNKPYFHLPLCA